MSQETIQIQKKERSFLPQEFTVKDWEEIKPYYQNLLDRRIDSAEAFKDWFKDRSELESVLSEELGWRYIRMTTDTTNEEYLERFNYFISAIEPNIAPFTNKLNEKAVHNSHLDEIIKEPGYDIMIRSLKKDIEIFREQNIALNTEIQKTSQKYGAISGAMTVEVQGKELTLQQAGDFLQSIDRGKREEAYRKISERRLADKDKLDSLYNNLIDLRDQVARNADFPNFRDYMFAAMGRFDYTAEDCFEFHDSVAEEVVPLLNEIAKDRKTRLGVEILRPWDKSVDPSGKQPLKPFSGGEDLTEKTIQCFSRLDPFLGERLAIMRNMGHLDLESRKGKAPGGYNYPLAEIGVPFIFMNATTKLRDMVTILHEGGHAVHSFLTRDLALNDFKHTPSEIAELASMSMELLTMDHWDVFFENKEDLRRAKQQHLEQIIETLPWVAIIDKFQHWVYENPGHNVEARVQQWNKIFDTFSDNITDWNGLKNYKDYVWQKQLHLYEVPFYYIEYAIAQLGAVAVWKNYKENSRQGLKGYLDALKLGYMKSLPEVYETAGIRFDFSKGYIKELCAFVKKELDSL